MPNKKTPKTIGRNPLDDLDGNGSDTEVTSSQQVAADSQAATDRSGDQSSRTVSSHSDQPDIEALFEAELSSGSKPQRLALTVVKQPDHRPNQIVRRWAQWSVAGGLVPLPLVDSLLISGAQVALIRDLCRHYDVPFEKKVALAVAMGLLGGTITTTVGQLAARSLVRNVPVVGTIFSITAEPAISYATTYGIGYTFIRHFESSGTLADFRADQMQDYFSMQVAKGKQIYKKVIP
jgi:uncharacterized protein (DUF697 family)